MVISGLTAMRTLRWHLADMSNLYLHCNHHEGVVSELCTALPGRSYAGIIQAADQTRSGVNSSRADMAGRRAALRFFVAV